MSSYVMKYLLPDTGVLSSDEIFIDRRWCLPM